MRIKLTLYKLRLMLLLLLCGIAIAAQAQAPYFRIVNGIPQLPVVADPSAVSSPLPGAMIYSTADSKVLLYNGKSWESFNSVNLPVTTGSKAYFTVVNGIPCLPVKPVLTGTSLSGDVFFPTTGGGLYVNSGTSWNKSVDYASVGSPANATTKIGTSATMTGGFKLPVLSAAPAGVTKGAVYISTTTKDLMFYDGAAWQQAYWATCPPIADGVLMDGDWSSLTHLDGSYSYYQRDGVAETGTFFRWYIADDAAGTNAVQDGNTVTWTGFTPARNGKYLKFEVAPQIAGKVYGLAQSTPWTKLFICPPQAQAPFFDPINVNYNAPFSFEVGYSYFDKEENPEGTSIVKWYISDDNLGTNKTLKYTGKPYSYTYNMADNNKWLSAGIIPVATAGYLTGDEIFTPYFQIKDCPPQVWPSINGDFATCKIPFSDGGYSYYDKEGSAENTVAVAYRWFLSATAGGTSVQNLSTLQSYTYTYSSTDDGKYLNLGVKVASLTPYTTSDEVIASGLLKNCPPQVSGIFISGTLTVGQTLTAGYAYYDREGDAEGASTYQWYQATSAAGAGQTPISGATSATYTLVAGNSGKFIGVGVTPKATAGYSAGIESTGFTATAIP